MKTFYSPILGKAVPPFLTPPAHTFISEDVDDARDECLCALGTLLDESEELWGLHAHAAHRRLQHAQDRPLDVRARLRVHLRQPAMESDGLIW
jgi:hypothetical protein